MAFENNKDRILLVLKELLKTSKSNPISIKKLQTILNEKNCYGSENTIRDDIHSIKNSGVKVEFVHGINSGWYVTDKSWLRSSSNSWKLVCIGPKYPGYSSKVLAKCSKCGEYLENNSKVFDGQDEEGRTIILSGYQTREKLISYAAGYPIDLFPKYCAHCGSKNTKLISDIEWSVVVGKI